MNISVMPGVMADENGANCRGNEEWPNIRNGMLDRDRSVLVVVDIQGSLFKDCFDNDAVLKNIIALTRAAKEMDIPVIVTEHYKRGLGGTVEEYGSLFPEDVQKAIQKITFSCGLETTFMEAVEATGRDQVLLVGIETHICVHQTALDLLDQGYEVYLGVDAVSARRQVLHDVGKEKMSSMGVLVENTEMAIFEWMRSAGTPTFKAMLPLIKDL